MAKTLTIIDRPRDAHLTIKVDGEVIYDETRHDVGIDTLTAVRDTAMRFASVSGMPIVCEFEELPEEKEEIDPHDVEAALRNIVQQEESSIESAVEILVENYFDGYHIRQHYEVAKCVAEMFSKKIVNVRLSVSNTPGVYVGAMLKVDVNAPDPMVIADMHEELIRQEEFYGVQRHTVFDIVFMMN